jgi:hypothetical protein
LTRERRLPRSPPAEQGQRKREPTAAKTAPSPHRSVACNKDRRGKGKQEAGKVSGPVSVLQSFHSALLWGFWGRWRETGRPTAAHLITGAAKGGVRCCESRVVVVVGVRSDRDEGAACRGGGLCGRRTRPVPLWSGGNCVQGSGSHRSRRRLFPSCLPLAGMIFLEQIEEDEFRCELIRPMPSFFPALLLSLGSCEPAQTPCCSSPSRPRRRLSVHLSCPGPPGSCGGAPGWTLFPSAATGKMPPAPDSHAGWGRSGMFVCPPPDRADPRPFLLGVHPPRASWPLATLPLAPSTKHARTKPSRSLSLKTRGLSRRVCPPPSPPSIARHHLPEVPHGFAVSTTAIAIAIAIPIPSNNSICRRCRPTAPYPIIVIDPRNPVGSFPDPFNTSDADRPTPIPNPDDADDHSGLDGATVYRLMSRGIYSDPDRERFSFYLFGLIDGRCH